MKKFLIIISILCIGASSLFAQSVQVSGTVTSDDDGQSMPGVSVIVKGTTLGTVTDVNGKYSISVSQGATLVFSFVGMATQEIAIENRQIVDVVMTTSAREIDEVVVVAYGTAKKSTITGSVAKVSGDELAMKNQSEISKALAGEVAGVQVFNASGQPGSNAAIRIRGYSSVNSRRGPLYVVDGIPYEGDISAIDPSDIESSSLLKDAASAAIYGSRGANGVILITTKKGSKGRASIEVDAKYGFNTRLIPLYDVIESPEEFMELTWGGLKNRGDRLGNPDPQTYASARMFNNNPSSLAISSAYNMWNAAGTDLIDPATGKFKSSVSRKYTPEKWADHIFDNGQRAEANMKISGGSDKLTYYTSFGWLKDEGYYLESDFSRISARSNVDFQPKDWFKGIINLSYANTQQNQPGQTDDMNNGFQFVNFMPPIFPVFERDDQGNIIPDTRIGGNLYDYGMTSDQKNRPYGSGINPAGAVRLDRDQSLVNQVAGNANFEISFLKDFKFIANTGMQYFNFMRSRLTNPYYGDAEGLGRIRKTGDNVFALTATQMVSYKKTLNGMHNIDAFVAHESALYKDQSSDGQKSKMVRPDNLEWSNAVIMDFMDSEIYDYNLESYFAQLRYDFDEKYFVHATFRRDGSSRFIDENKWGNFGSIGVAWAMNKEDFMQDLDWIDMLKLKASYGTLGNQFFNTTIIPANFYPTRDLYTITNLDDEVSINFLYKGNADLTWEHSNMFNTGFEATLWDRLDVEFEFFNKRTTNMLYFKQVSPSKGYASYPVNDGQLNNTGVEFTLAGDVIKNNDMTLTLRFNGACYTNKMVKMPMDDGTKQPKIIETQGRFGWSEGHSIYDFYLREWAGVNPDNGYAQWYAYYNEKADGTKDYILNMEDYESKNTINKLGKEITSNYNQATLKYSGHSAIPKIAGGFGIDFSYMGFELNTTLTYSLGGYGYDAVYATSMGDETPGGMNWHKDIRNRWQKPGDITNVPALSAGFDASDTYGANPNSASDRFIVKNSYLNMNNIRLSYHFPKRMIDKIKLSKLTLWVSGENLFLLCARKGYVPYMTEMGESQRSQYIPLSTFTTGIKLQF